MRARGKSLFALVMFSLWGCSCGEEGQPSGGTGGVGTDGGPDAMKSDADAAAGSSGAAWDPVWHETEAKDWPKAPKANPEGCGEGCRVGLDVIPSHPSYVHFVDSDEGLACVNVDMRNVFFSRFGGEETTILAVGNIDAPFNAFTGPCLWGNTLSFVYVKPENVGGEVRVMNVVTGETKVAHSYAIADQDLGVDFSLLNDKYVFWNRVGKGIMSRHLETGEVRTLVNAVCDDFCATPKGLICFDSPNKFIDQETGAMTVIDSGGALQVDGTCAHERDEIIWVDYRDPPGPGSDYFGPRSGGEIYVKNLVSGEQTRLTHDSPDAPEAKAYPAVGKELAVWKGVSAGFEKNPTWGQDVYAVTQDLIVLDRKTGERCRIHSDLVKYFTHMVVVGRWVYGSMGYVVGIDVDHPAIGCVKE